MKSQSVKRKERRKVQSREIYVKISDIYFDIDNCADVARIISTIDYFTQVNANHMHSDLTPVLNAEGCRMLLEQFPILVYKDNDKYMCFAGLRSFFLAHMIFASGEKVLVRMYDKKASNPEEYAFAGLFLGEMFLLLKSHDDLGKIVNAMSPTLLSKWLNGVSNKTQLASVIGISRTHFKKPHQGEEQ